MENSILKRRLARKVSRLFAAFLLIGGPMSWSSCTDDLLTGTPSWLGSSIYEELESRGDFKTTLALINDPDLSETNYPDMLRRTGSLTLFVADDAAWSKFLQKRGVSSVSELSRAEKKNLLKGAMINNAYLIELLSHRPSDNYVTPPSEGILMRRDSRLSVSDSIPLISKDEMPALNPARITVGVDGSTSTTDYWASVRNRDHIYIYKDNTLPTMVHFTPDFMTANDITKEDIQKLTNGECEDIDRSYINGLPVAKNDGRWPDKDVNTDGSSKTFLQDITCQNGYIHVLEQVPEPLPNMAEIIRTKPQFSIFSSLLERYSYPQFIGIRSLDGREDSIFVKRYFNSGHADHALNTVTETNTKISEVLALDPGWNSYQLNATSVSMGSDAAAIFVPTNEWMEKYITTGDGHAIGAKYGNNWDNVPDEVVIPFLNNCMKSSLISTVPSKFANVKNTQSEAMGLTIDKVDSCFMACNGMVYQMNAVYVAPDHQSIFFPVRLRQDEDLNIMFRFLSDERYKPAGNVEWTGNWTGYENKAYVNSMASTYSFLLPKDNAFSAVIDPYFDYEGKPAAFRYYVEQSNPNFPVSIDIYQAELDSATFTYTVTDVLNDFQPHNYSTADASNKPHLGLVNNRLSDFFENLIIVHGQKGAQTFHAGQEIYLTKGGNPIKVHFEGDKVTGIAGSAQMEKGVFIPVSDEYDLRENGNGISYLLDEVPTTTLTSPYQLINDSVNHAEFLPFANLLYSSSILGTEGFYDATHVAKGRPINILGKYHYTIYIPQADKINALIEAHKLPSFGEYEEWDNVKKVADTLYTKKLLTTAENDSIIHLADSCKGVVKAVIDNFVKYHIQDGSVYLGGEQGAAVYETAAYDDASSRFRRLHVTNSGSGISILDDSGKTVNVMASSPHSNLVARQYVFEKDTRWYYVTSPVVIHLIDDVLLYSADQFLPDGFPKPAYPTPSSEVKRK